MVAHLLDGAQELQRLLAVLPLPTAKPKRVALTDKGPGVGVNQRQVSPAQRLCTVPLLTLSDSYIVCSCQVLFFDLLLTLVLESSSSIRVHRAVGDSCEAERLMAALGNAVVDGSSLKWEINTFDQWFSGKVSCFSFLAVPTWAPPGGSYRIFSVDSLSHGACLFVVYRTRPA
jgi:hypothetical protein